MPLIPAGFPKMLQPPRSVDALAWYDMHDAPHGLTAMQYQARDEVVPLHHPHPTDPKLVGVPRTLAPIDAPGVENNRSAGAFTFDAEFTSALRPEQVPFVEQVFNTLEQDHGCIGEAPTGFGKTTTGCWLAAKFGRPTCIVLPKGDLDWDKELVKHTTIPPEKIDVWQGQRLPDPEAWVVIAMLQSVYREGIYPKEVYERFGCLIVDEVHRVAASEFSAVMRKFPAYIRLGLSATAHRRDGKMDLVHAHMGWRHVVGHSDAEQPDYYVIRSAWSEPFIKGKRVHYDPKRTNPAKKSLMADSTRNAQIAGAALRAHKAGRRTIVFIEQKKHGEKLAAAMKSMGVPAASIIHYNGEVTAEDSKRAKECPAGIILIATYKYTAEGTNIPALDTAIIAHPVYDATQPKGRITRKPEPGQTKPKPVVIDVWDEGSGALRRIATARWEFMRKQGAIWKGEFG